MGYAPVKLMQDVSQDVSGWLEMRRQSIGSSDLPTIAGLNPYQSPYELWALKTGKITKPRIDSDILWLGHELEPVCAKLFSKKTGIGHRRNDSLFAHPDNRAFTATPDAFLDEGGAIGLLEIKTTNHRNAPAWDDQIPDYAHLQVQWQLGIMGMAWGYVCCLIGGQEFRYRATQFSNEVFERGIALASEFMNLVYHQTPPEPRGSDLELVRTLHPREAGTTVALIPDAEKMVAEYYCLAELLSKARSAERKLIEEVDTLKAKILTAMGNAETAHTNEFTITAKEFEVREHTVPARKNLRFTVKPKLTEPKE